MRRGCLPVLAFATMACGATSQGPSLVDAPGGAGPALEVNGASPLVLVPEVWPALQGDGPPSALLSPGPGAAWVVDPEVDPLHWAVALRAPVGPVLIGAIEWATLPGSAAVCTLEVRASLQAAALTRARWPMPLLDAAPVATADRLCGDEGTRLLLFDPPIRAHLVLLQPRDAVRQAAMPRLAMWAPEDAPGREARCMAVPEACRFTRVTLPDEDSPALDPAP